MTSANPPKNSQYDDLLLERDDRRKLAAAAAACRAELVLVYLDTPAEVIAARRAQNSRARTRGQRPRQQAGPG